MGSQNAQQCTNLIARAHLAHKERSSDLSKEGKSFQLPFASTGSDIRDTFNLGTAIQTCTMMDSLGTGMGMIGPFGGGMGTGMGGFYPEAAPGAKEKGGVR